MRPGPAAQQSTVQPSHSPCASSEVVRTMWRCTVLIRGAHFSFSPFRNPPFISCRQNLSLRHHWRPACFPDPINNHGPAIPAPVFFLFPFPLPPLSRFLVSPSLTPTISPSPKGQPWAVLKPRVIVRDVRDRGKNKRGGIYCTYVLCTFFAASSPVKWPTKQTGQVDWRKAG